MFALKELLFGWLEDLAEPEGERRQARRHSEADRDFSRRDYREGDHRDQFRSRRDNDSWFDD